MQLNVKRLISPERRVHAVPGKYVKDYILLWYTEIRKHLYFVVKTACKKKMAVYIFDL